MSTLTRWLFAIAAPLLLSSCILTPGKFVSTLDIRADRTFTFTYLGEVQLAKTKSSGGGDLQGNDQSWERKDSREPSKLSIAMRRGFGSRTIADEQVYGDSADEVAQLNALAEALSKEYGFRSVRYVGNRKLAIDYAITGKLDHAFIFPFNPDADVLLPFIAIELRGKDRIRIKAPGYANQQSMASSIGGLGGLPASGADSAGSEALDGTFTLTTNAEIVSQNQENGSETLADGNRRVVWQANPQTKEAPMAVLKLDALP